jgi:hypothetical protein
LATPATVETAADTAMTEMTTDQFAEFLMSKVAKPGESEAKAEPTVEATEDATAPEAVDDKAEKEVVEGESEQEPETADSPETEDDLSQSDTVPPEKKAKWEASVQKRIDKEVAKTKALEAKLAEMEAKLAAPQDVPEAPAPVVIPLDSPDDKTVVAKSEADLEKLARDAQSALDFIESNELAIQKAALRDEDKVVIGGREFDLNYLLDAKREAKRHLDRYIPARRQFIKASATATQEAQTILPAMFTRGTPEYLEFQSLKRQYPALAAVPDAERLWALAKRGQQALEAEKQAAAKPAVKSAASTAPKTAGDTGTTAAAKPTASRTSASEKAKLRGELDKAVKRFESTGSHDDYSRMLVLETRWKKL